MQYSVHGAHRVFDVDSMEVVFVYACSVRQCDWLPTKLGGAAPLSVDRMAVAGV